VNKIALDPLRPSIPQPTTNKTMNKILAKASKLLNPVKTCENHNFQIALFLGRKLSSASDGTKPKSSDDTDKYLFEEAEKYYLNGNGMCKLRL
jgi:hypothetical protein